MERDQTRLDTSAAPPRSAATDGDGQAKDATSTGLWMERSVVGLLRLLTDTLWTAWAIFMRPHRLPIDWMHGTARPAPPFSFLIIGLLCVGIAIRMSVLYFDRVVDESILRRLGETLGSLALKDVLLLTVPCVVLVKMAAAGVARWTRPQMRFEQNPVVVCICYAAGFQCLAIAAICAASLVVKIVTREASVLPSQHEDDAVLIAGAMILLISSLLVYSAIRSAGTTWLTRSRIASGMLSLLTVATTLIGVLIVNSISFDLETTIGEVRRFQQKENLGDLHVAMRTIDSRLIGDVDGSSIVEVTVAMMNISEETVAVPRPRALESGVDPKLPVIEVIGDSLDRTGQAGWIIAPGETTLTTWMLRMPNWCREVHQRHGGVAVMLSCTPLNREVDYAQTHPIGDPIPILAMLKVPDLRSTSAASDEKRVAGDASPRY